MNDRHLAYTATISPPLGSPSGTATSLDVGYSVSQGLSAKGVKGRCWGRLANGHILCEPLDGCVFMSVKHCKNNATGSINLCARCAHRPLRSMDASVNLYGLLNEPMPEWAPLYGSAQYWKTVGDLKDAGISPDRQWITEATLAQMEAERHCGVSRAWKVQRPRVKDIQMRGKAKVADGRIQTTLTTLRVAYEETEDMPEKICSEVLGVRLLVRPEGNLWIAENGLVFAWKEKNEIGDLLGHWKDNKIEKLEAKE